MPILVCLRILAAACVAVLLVGGTGFVSGAAEAQKPLTLHIATGGKETDAEVFYAKDLGFFTRAGLNVDIEVMQNGAAIGSAIAAGSLDIGSSGTLIVARAHQRGFPFVFIAPAGQYNSATPATVLAVAKNSPVHSAADLNGKTIATLTVGALDQSLAEEWIARNGGDSASVKFVEIAPAEMTAALERGAVDAAMLAEPFLSTAGTNVRTLGKPYDVLGKRWLIAGWFSTTNWIAKNPEAARKFAEVMRQTADWANANPARAAAILEKYTKLKLGGHLHTVYAESFDPATSASIDSAIDIGVKYKILTKAVPAGDIVWASAKSGVTAPN